MGTVGDTVAIATYDGGSGNLYGIGVGVDMLTFGAAIASNGTPQMVLTSTGDVGIGTTGPVANLQVNGTQTNQPAMLIYGDTATYWPQVSLWFDDSASGGHNYSIGNAGSTGSFSIADQTAASARITINTTGEVGIGTTSPSYTLQVNGSVAGTSAYTNTSDVRLKTDITPLAYGLDAVMKLHPVGFNWKNQDQEWKKQHQIGLIAQEVKTVVPEVVTVADDEMQTESIAYGSLVPVLIQAIQELKADNDNLKRAVADLQSTATTSAALTVPSVHR
jgi:trimeric autotransporter adhesin